MRVQQQGATCGAIVSGVNLSGTLTGAQVAEIRKHWLEHQVLAFVDQDMSVEDIERFALTVGPFGTDPFFESIPGHPHVAQVRRDADEKTPIFAEAWHSDWSFMEQPPAATVLYGNIVPPVGGNTRFTNLYAAWDELPADLKALVTGKRGIHSAGRAYARDGAYGEKDKGRSMKIRYSDDALAAQYAHPIARVHPETGRTALFVSPGYTVGIEGMRDEEAKPLLIALFKHLNRPEFEYSHRWSQGSLLMWDNRCVNHAASGGYDGHARLLHRVTVADRTFLQ